MLELAQQGISIKDPGASGSEGNGGAEGEEEENTKVQLGEKQLGNEGQEEGKREGEGEFDILNGQRTWKHYGRTKGQLGREGEGEGAEDVRKRGRGEKLKDSAEGK